MGASIYMYCTSTSMTTTNTLVENEYLSGIALFWASYNVWVGPINIEFLFWKKVVVLGKWSHVVTLRGGQIPSFDQILSRHEVWYYSYKDTWVQEEEEDGQNGKTKSDICLLNFNTVP